MEVLTYMNRFFPHFWFHFNFVKEMICYHFEGILRPSLVKLDMKITHNKRIQTSHNTLWFQFNDMTLIYLEIQLGKNCDLRSKDLHCLTFSLRALWSYARGNVRDETIRKNCILQKQRTSKNYDYILETNQ